MSVLGFWVFGLAALLFGVLYASLRQAVNFPANLLTNPETEREPVFQVPAPFYVFSMMMILWHKSTKTKAHLAPNKFL
jgi:hypothetical protein